MPRPRRLRRVSFWPPITYFKPAGIRLAGLQEVILTLDEFEALRLKDFEGLEQEKAAKKMGISQPTFNRLLASARKKVVDAMVNGKAIKVEGGAYKMIRAGRGRGFGAPPANCRCPVCGTVQPKVRGIPCSQMRCPKCGALMVRE